jgi:hypothetical protein
MAKSRLALMDHQELMHCCNNCDCWQVRVAIGETDMDVSREAHALYCHFNQSDTSFNKGQALLDYMHERRYQKPKFVKLQVKP